MVKEHKSQIKASLPNGPVSVNTERAVAAPAEEQSTPGMQVAICKGVL